MSAEDHVFKGEPDGNNPVFLDNCPRIQVYVLQFEQLPENEAKDTFFQTRDNSPETELPFLYRALQQVHPTAAAQVKKEWPAVESIVGEMEAGGH